MAQAGKIPQRSENEEIDTKQWLVPLFHFALVHFDIWDLNRSSNCLFTFALVALKHHLEHLNVEKLCLVLPKFSNVKFFS